MTKEETAECIKVMQAYTNGEIIEEKRLSFDSTEWVESIDPTWQWYKFDYRIKPRSKYRPFKNAEECWEEMLKHQPFGWVKNIEFEKYFLIDEVTSIFSDAQIHISAYEGKNWNSFSTVFYNNTFADGTPFGIREC